MPVKRTFLAIIAIVILTFLARNEVPPPPAQEQMALLRQPETPIASGLRETTIAPVAGGENGTGGTSSNETRLYAKRKSPEELAPSVRAIRERILASPIGRNGDILILKTTGSYRIEYEPLSFPRVPYTGVFFVTIFNDPPQRYKDEAQSWFRSFGLSQTDLCDLPVAFLLGTPALRAAYPNFYPRPDDCLPLEPL